MPDCAPGLSSYHLSAFNIVYSFLSVCGVRKKRTKVHALRPTSASFIGSKTHLRILGQREPSC